MNSVTAVFLLLTLLAARISAQNTVLQVLQQTTSLSQLYLIASLQPDIVQLLNATANITVFAPSNIAFIAYENQPNSSFSVDQILRYHIVSSNFSLNNSYDGELLKTSFLAPALNYTAQVSKITVAGSQFLVDGVVINSQVIASNGVVLFINSVLVPPANTTTVLQGLPSIFSNFTTLINNTDSDFKNNSLANVLNNQSTTVFAPVNSAFQNTLVITDDYFVSFLVKSLTIPGDVLYLPTLLAQQGSFSVMSAAGSLLNITVHGSNITLNGTINVITTSNMSDIITNNGVVHGITGLFLPAPAITLATTGDNLTALLTNMGLTNFLQAMQSTNSYNDLLTNANAVFTVFAVDNSVLPLSAFASTSSAQLTNVLNNMIVDQMLSLVKGSQGSTLNGQQILINVPDYTGEAYVYISRSPAVAKILQSGTTTSGKGVVFYINRILNPTAGRIL